MAACRATRICPSTGGQTRPDRTGPDRTGPGRAKPYATLMPPAVPAARASARCLQRNRTSGVLQTCVRCARLLCGPRPMTGAKASSWNWAAAQAIVIVASLPMTSNAAGPSPPGSPDRSCPRCSTSPPWRAGRWMSPEPACGPLGSSRRSLQSERQPSGRESPWKPLAQADAGAASRSKAHTRSPTGDGGAGDQRPEARKSHSASAPALWWRAISGRSR